MAISPLGILLKVPPLGAAGAGLDIVAQNYQSNVNAVDSIPDAHIAAIHAFVAGLKSDSLLVTDDSGIPTAASKLKDFFPMLGATAAGGVVKLFTTTGTNSLTNVSATSYSQSLGFTGDGAADYLRTGFIPSSHGGDDFSLGIYSPDALVGTNAIAARNSIFDRRQFLAPRSVGATMTFLVDGADRIDSGTLSTSGGAWGSLIASKLGTNMEVYQNGISVVSGSVIATPNKPTVEYYILALNDNGTASSHSATTAACGFIGDGLTDTDVSNLDGHILTLMQAVGKA